jgi:histidine triad (HIT) family protein
MDDCLFCKIVAGKVPAKKVAENEGAIAFPDINPCMPVHVLVIPKKHVASLNEVGDGSVMAPVFALAEQVARQNGLDKSGWRAVINTGPDAHQVVFHIHLHVLGGRKMGWPPG